jgi:hypothetical protein
MIDLVQLICADEQHAVNNVAFEKVSILGQPRT